MTNKKTFPGAMNAEQRAAFARQQAEEQKAAENAKKLAAEEAAAIRIAKKMKLEAAQRRNDLINKFAKTNLKGKVKSFLLACVGFNIPIGYADRLFTSVEIVEPYDCYDEGDIERRMQLKDVIQEAYDPYFHATKGEYCYKDNSIDTYWKPDNKPSYRDTSKVNNRFKRHMMLVCIEALVLACVVIGALRKRRAVAQDVDIMLEVEKIADSKKVSSKLIRKMLNVVPEIVGHMSSESSVYFEMLLKGDFDCKQNPQVLEISKAILSGHLASHPKDMERVLAVFDEASLPQSLVAEYKQNVR